MSKSSPHAALARALDWYRAMGVDCAIGETAIDWTSRGDRGPGAGFRLSEALIGGVAAAAPASRQPPNPRSAEGRPLHASPGAQRSAASRDLEAIASLAALEAALANFDGCALKATATKLCVYRGAETARLMIIGEAPGRDEDLAGRPFVGRAGQLLDKMLAAIGLGEQDVHITNVVYWRPPGNRTPTPAEAEACRPFLERQIGLVGPDIILALGGSAAKHMLNTTSGIMQVRGQMRAIEAANRKIPLLASLHPAYLLRTPAAKRLAWADLLQLKDFLSR